MMDPMWEQYEPPSERPEQQSATPDPGLRPSGPGRRPPLVAGGSRPGSGSGVAVGLVATLAIIGIGVGLASSGDPEPDYSGFYACVAEEEADDPGLLSPADLCDIGNERPPDYVDDYEYDVFDNADNGDDEYGFGN